MGFVVRLSARKRGYTWRWEKVRKLYLQEHPLCRMCAKGGRDEPATVVDHIIPHKGDDYLMWDTGNWQSLCETHHNKHKQRQERGSIQAVDEDGWPLSSG